MLCWMDEFWCSEPWVISNFQENDCSLWCCSYYVSATYIQTCINVSIQKCSSIPEIVQLYCS